MSHTGSISSFGTGAPLPPRSDGANTPLLDRQATQLRLERAQERRSRTQAELETLERVRSITPHMSPFEIDKKDREIDTLKHKLNGMEAQIKYCADQLQRAETTIKQQQVTIHNQSKQIENPRGRDASAPGTAVPNYHNQQHRPVLPNVPNQSWNAPQGQPGNHQYGPAQQPLGHQRFGSASRTFTGQQYGGQQQQLGLPPAFNPQMSLTASQPQQQHTSAPVWNSVNPNQQQQYDQSRPSINSYGNNNNADHHMQSPMPMTALHRVNDVGSPESLRQHYPSTPNRQVMSSNLSKVNTPSHNQEMTESDPFAGIQTYYGTPSSSGHKDASAHNATYQSQQVCGFNRDRSLTNPYAPAPLDQESGAMVLVPGFTVDQYVCECIEHLFASVKNYAFNHVNFVNTSGDTALPNDLKQRIIKAGTLKTAFPIFKSPETRYWLVTKIMLQWIVKHIFKQSVFSGFNTKADELIESTKNTLYQSTPAQLRFLLLKNIGDHIKETTNNPHFTTFLEHLVKERSNQLYWLVRPMAHQPTMMDEQDMHEIIREAHEVARLIFSSTDEYRFNFYEAGPPYCRYNPQTMRNVDPRYGNHEDTWLQQIHASVRLCATPEVIVRQNNAQGTGQEGQLQKGRVLISVRGDNYL